MNPIHPANHPTRARLPPARVYCANAAARTVSICELQITRHRD